MYLSKPRYRKIDTNEMQNYINNIARHVCITLTSQRPETVSYLGNFYIIKKVQYIDDYNEIQNKYIIRQKIV